MYRLLVVPLDGSPFGERAIPLALAVARHPGATVELTHVHEPFAFRGGVPLPDTRFDIDVRQAMRAHLDRLQERIGAKAGVPVTATFLEGDVVPTLQAHIEARGADLVVMTTHGRGGMSRAWLGSVADALVRRLRAPVLLVRARAKVQVAAGKPPFRRILVPLDGSDMAEEALDHAIAMGVRSHTEYLLVRVAVPIQIGPQAHGHTVIRNEDLDFVMREAQLYLAGVAERIRRPGIPVNVTVVAHRQPARAILDLTREREIDLIALATHSRRGLSRVMLGSVADKVIRAAPVPILVYAPGAAAAE